MFKTLTVFLFFLIVTNGCAPHRSVPAYTPRCISPSAAAPCPTRPVYVVKKGDSLWLISKKYGVSVDDLKRENKITNASRIKVGQKIYIPPSASLYKKQGLFFIPVKGKIIHYFGEVIDNRLNKGIKIRTDNNAGVISAMEGTVVFKEYLKGYGTTVIIEHPGNLTTVYANLSEVTVKKNDYVQKGQALGAAAPDPANGGSLLHFEIRRGHRAEDPLLYVNYHD